jgi:hypothetical protein
MANRITTVVEYAVRDAIKSLEDTQKELGKTEISGKDLADALRKAADDSERELDSIARASSAMETALGADFVEARRQAGVSVDDIVMELSNLGVSFNNIETDAKELAEAVKRLDDVRTPIKNVGTEAQTVSTKLDAVRDSGDQSRSVLANLVGNSAQDLGELGGVAGTAGVALGQLAEYAADGNIKMSNLAKFAGPMVGVGVAVAGISWAMGKLREESEKAKREAEQMLKVQEAIRDGKFEEAGADLAEAYGGLVSELEKMGVPADEVMQFMIGASEQMPTFNALLEENKIQFAEGGEGLTDFGGKLNDLGGDVYDARDAFRDQEEQLNSTEKATGAFTEALIRSARETGTTKIAVKDLEAAIKDLQGELSAEEAFLNMEESLAQFRADMASGELSTLEQRQALVDMKQELLEVLTSMEGIPAEKQSEVIALIDKGAYDEAERALNNLARERGVPLIAQPGGLGAGIKFRAAGGPVNRGDTVVVGEQGPELLHMGSNGYVSPNRVFDSMGGTGTTNVYIQTNADPNSTKAALRRWERRNGPGLS